MPLLLFPRRRDAVSGDKPFPLLSSPSHATPSTLPCESNPQVVLALRHLTSVASWYSVPSAALLEPPAVVEPLSRGPRCVSLRLSSLRTEPAHVLPNPPLSHLDEEAQCSSSFHAGDDEEPLLSTARSGAEPCQPPFGGEIFAQNDAAFPCFCNNEGRAWLLEHHTAITTRKNAVSALGEEGVRRTLRRGSTVEEESLSSPQRTTLEEAVGVPLWVDMDDCQQTETSVSRISERVTRKAKECLYKVQQHLQRFDEPECIRKAVVHLRCPAAGQTDEAVELENPSPTSGLVRIGSQTTNRPSPLVRERQEMRTSVPTGKSSSFRVWSALATMRPTLHRCAFLAPETALVSSAASHASHPAAPPPRSGVNEAIPPRCFTSYYVPAPCIELCSDNPFFLLPSPPPLPSSFILTFQGDPSLQCSTTCRTSGAVQRYRQRFNTSLSATSHIAAEPYLKDETEEATLQQTAARLVSEGKMALEMGCLRSCGCAETHTNLRHIRCASSLTPPPHVWFAAKPAETVNVKEGSHEIFPTPLGDVLQKSLFTRHDGEAEGSTTVDHAARWLPVLQQRCQAACSTAVREDRIGGSSGGFLCPDSWMSADALLEKAALRVLSLLLLEKDDLRPSASSSHAQTKHSRTTGDDKTSDHGGENTGGRTQLPRGLMKLPPPPLLPPPPSVLVCGTLLRWSHVESTRYEETHRGVVLRFSDPPQRSTRALPSPLFPRLDTADEREYLLQTGTSVWRCRVPEYTALPFGEPSEREAEWRSRTLHPTETETTTMAPDASAPDSDDIFTRWNKAFKRWSCLKVGPTPRCPVRETVETVADSVFPTPAVTMPSFLYFLWECRSVSAAVEYHLPQSHGFKVKVRTYTQTFVRSFPLKLLRRFQDEWHQCRHRSRKRRTASEAACEEVTAISFTMPTGTDERCSDMLSHPMRTEWPLSAPLKRYRYEDVWQRSRVEERLQLLLDDDLEEEEEEECSLIRSLSKHSSEDHSLNLNDANLHQNHQHHHSSTHETRSGSLPNACERGGREENVRSVSEGDYVPKTSVIEAKKGSLRATSCSRSCHSQLEPKLKEPYVNETDCSEPMPHTPDAEVHTASATPDTEDEEEGGEWIAVERKETTALVTQCQPPAARMESAALRTVLLLCGKPSLLMRHPSLQEECFLADVHLPRSLHVRENTLHALKGNQKFLVKSMAEEHLPLRLPLTRAILSSHHRFERISARQWWTLDSTDLPCCTMRTPWRQASNDRNEVCEHQQQQTNGFFFPSRTTPLLLTAQPHIWSAEIKDHAAVLPTASTAQYPFDDGDRFGSHECIGNHISTDKFVMDDDQQEIALECFSHTHSQLEPKLKEPHVNETDCSEPMPHTPEAEVHTASATPDTENEEEGGEWIAVEREETTALVTQCQPPAARMESAALLPLAARAMMECDRTTPTNAVIEVVNREGENNERARCPMVYDCMKGGTEIRKNTSWGGSVSPSSGAPPPLTTSDHSHQPQSPCPAPPTAAHSSSSKCRCVVVSSVTERESHHCTPNRRKTSLCSSQQRSRRLHVKSPILSPEVWLPSSVVRVLSVSTGRETRATPHHRQRSSVVPVRRPSCCHWRSFRLSRRFLPEPKSVQTASSSHTAESCSALRRVLLLPPPVTVPLTLCGPLPPVEVNSMPFRVTTESNVRTCEEGIVRVHRRRTRQQEIRSAQSREITLKELRQEALESFGFTPVPFLNSPHDLTGFPVQHQKSSKRVALSALDANFQTSMEVWKARVSHDLSTEDTPSPSAAVSSGSLQHLAAACPALRHQLEQSAVHLHRSGPRESLSSLPFQSGGMSLYNFAKARLERLRDDSVRRSRESTGLCGASSAALQTAQSKALDSSVVYPDWSVRDAQRRALRSEWQRAYYDHWLSLEYQLGVAVEVRSVSFGTTPPPVAPQEAVTAEALKSCFLHCGAVYIADLHHPLLPSELLYWDELSSSALEQKCAAERSILLDSSMPVPTNDPIAIRTTPEKKKASSEGREEPPSPGFLCVSSFRSPVMALQEASVLAEQHWKQKTCSALFPQSRTTGNRRDPHPEALGVVEPLCRVGLTRERLLIFHTYYYDLLSCGSPRPDQELLLRPRLLQLPAYLPDHGSPSSLLLRCSESEKRSLRSLFCEVTLPAQWGSTLPPSHSYAPNESQQPVTRCPGPDEGPNTARTDIPSVSGSPASGSRASPPTLHWWRTAVLHSTRYMFCHTMNPTCLPCTPSPASGGFTAHRLPLFQYVGRPQNEGEKRHLLGLRYAEDTAEQRASLSLERRSAGSRLPLKAKERWWHEDGLWCHQILRLAAADVLQHLFASILDQPTPPWTCADERTPTISGAPALLRTVCVPHVFTLAEQWVADVAALRVRRCFDSIAVSVKAPNSVSALSSIALLGGAEARRRSADSNDKWPQKAPRKRSRSPPFSSQTASTLTADTLRDWLPYCVWPPVAATPASFVPVLLEEITNRRPPSFVSLRESQLRGTASPITVKEGSTLLGQQKSSSDSTCLGACLAGIPSLVAHPIGSSLPCVPSVEDPEDMLLWKAVEQHLLRQPSSLPRQALLKDEYRLARKFKEIEIREVREQAML